MAPNTDAGFELEAKHQLLKVTHRQQLCVYPPHTEERSRRLQVDDVKTDHDLPGPLPRICTLRGRREKEGFSLISCYFIFYITTCNKVEKNKNYPWNVGGICLAERTSLFKTQFSASSNCNVSVLVKASGIFINKRACVASCVESTKFNFQDPVSASGDARGNFKITSTVSTFSREI